MLVFALCGLLSAGPRRPPERPVNINTATVTELMQLPRVGPKTAQRIIAFRARAVPAAGGPHERQGHRRKDLPPAGAPRHRDRPGTVSARGPSARSGFSLLELLAVLAIVLALGALAAGALDRGSAALTAVQGELRASVEQAFLLARSRGGPVRVALGGPAPARRHPREWAGVLSLTLPRGVRWGVPQDIPLPAGMGDTVRAHLTGQAHPCITVTPAGTAEASTWFLSDGRDAVCLRLGDQGQITLLRWRHRLRRWERR